MYASSRFCRLFSLWGKVNTADFIILSQLLRELEYDYNNIVIIQVNASKCATYSKNHFTHLQQYDVNHCVYRARIGRRSENADRNVTANCSIEFTKVINGVINVSNAAN